MLFELSTIGSYSSIRWLSARTNAQFWIGWGIFDEELVRNQDDEYNYRIREFGGKILLTPDIRSRYYSRSTLRSLWRQYLKYGFYKVRVLQLHPLQMQPRQFVPLIFVVSCYLALPLRFSYGRIA